jgi:hypothetical protein
MPPYPGNSLATLLYENKQGFAWNNELVAQGATSIAFQLRRERGAYYPNGISVQVQFSANPGTFEVDVMTSDTDEAGFYVQVASITATNATFVGRVELPNIWAKYVALNMKTSPNAATVTVTALITR